MRTFFFREKLFITLVFFCAFTSSGYCDMRFSAVRYPGDNLITTASAVPVIIFASGQPVTVTVNGSAPGSATLHKGVYHAVAELIPGKNKLTILIGAEKQIRSVMRIDPRSAVTLSGKWKPALFHVSRLEKRCTACHGFKPGENDRKTCMKCHESLFASYLRLHAPAVNGQCKICHAAIPGSAAARFLVPLKTKDICAECHDLQISGKAGRHLHGPLGAGQCQFCHDPHGGRSAPFLIASEPGLCLDCHTDIRDILEKRSRFVHPVLAEKSCSTCHNAHASPYPFQLKQPVNRLCLTCHAARLYGDKLHPVRNHPVEGVQDPSNRKQTMSCVSCHNPHAGLSAKLLKSGNALELCGRCHRI